MGCSICLVLEHTSAAAAPAAGSAGEPQAEGGGRRARLWALVVALVLVVPAARVWQPLLDHLVLRPRFGWEPEGDLAILRWFSTPQGIYTWYLPLVLFVAVAALLFVSVSGRGFREGLRLKPLRVSPRVAVALATGSVLPGAALFAVALWLTTGSVRIPWPPTITESGAMHVIAITVLWSVGPAVGEELFFRGFVQRGLEERLRPGVAIVVASVAFALWHVDPFQALPAFAIGLWLGVVAYACGSVWPAILGHFQMNLMLVLVRLLWARGTSPVAGDVLAIAWLVVSAAGLVYGVARLSVDRRR